MTSDIPQDIDGATQVRQQGQRLTCAAIIIPYDMPSLVT